jgi:hypothetical protein
MKVLGAFLLPRFSPANDNVIDYSFLIGTCVSFSSLLLEIFPHETDIFSKIVPFRSCGDDCICVVFLKSKNINDTLIGNNVNLHFWMRLIVNTENFASTAANDDGYHELLHSDTELNMSTTPAVLFAAASTCPHAIFTLRIIR